MWQPVETLACASASGMAAVSVSRTFRAVAKAGLGRGPVRWKHVAGKGDAVEVFVNATYAARAIDLGAVVQHAKEKWCVVL